MRVYSRGTGSSIARSPGTWPDGLFAAGGARAARLVATDGGETHLDLDRWHGVCTLDDHDALSRAMSPVLDIGCGPGRHVQALLARGVDALGIDVSPVAVRAAHRRGAHATVASVWGAVPRCGYWQSALLLDGNIGIGGDPVALLRRAVQLLGGPRRLIVELADRSVSPGPQVVRVEHDGRIGPWFAWAVVSPDSIGDIAAACDLTTHEIWRSSTRWFATLSAQARSETTEPSRGEATEMEGSAA